MTFMTPEDRARHCYSYDGTSQDEQITNCIKAAENDAFERAAMAAEAQACTFGSMAEEVHSQKTASDAAAAIRTLKHAVVWGDVP